MLGFKQPAIKQMGFKNFEQPNVSKVLGGSAYSGMTAERQGLKLQGMQASESKDANKSGLKNLLTKGY